MKQRHHPTSNPNPNPNPKDLLLACMVFTVLSCSNSGTQKTPPGAASGSGYDRPASGVQPQSSPPQLTGVVVNGHPDGSGAVEFDLVDYVLPQTAYSSSSNANLILSAPGQFTEFCPMSPNATAGNNNEQSSNTPCNCYFTFTTVGGTNPPSLESPIYYAEADMGRCLAPSNIPTNITSAQLQIHVLNANTYTNILTIPLTGLNPNNINNYFRIQPYACRLVPEAIWPFAYNPPANQNANQQNIVSPVGYYDPFQSGTASANFQTTLVNNISSAYSCFYSSNLAQSIQAFTSDQNTYWAQVDYKSHLVRTDCDFVLNPENTLPAGAPITTFRTNYPNPNNTQCAVNLVEAANLPDNAFYLSREATSIFNQPLYIDSAPLYQAPAVAVAVGYGATAQTLANDYFACPIDLTTIPANMEPAILNAGVPNVTATGPFIYSNKVFSTSASLITKSPVPNFQATCYDSNIGAVGTPAGTVGGLDKLAATVSAFNIANLVDRYIDFDTNGANTYDVCSVNKALSQKTPNACTTAATSNLCLPSDTGCTAVQLPVAPTQINVRAPQLFVFNIPTGGLSTTAMKQQLSPNFKLDTLKVAGTLNQSTLPMCVLVQSAASANIAQAKKTLQKLAKKTSHTQPKKISTAF
jgi:hypothetical protein